MSGLIANPDMMSLAIQQAGGNHTGPMNTALAAQTRQNYTMQPTNYQQPQPTSNKIATVGAPTTPTTTVSPTQPQPSTTPTAPTGPSLNDLTYFNNRSYGGIGQEEVNSQRGQDTLVALRHYDSNAQFAPTYTSDGNLMGYQLQYDPSKLPGMGDSSHPLGGSNPNTANAGNYVSGSGFMPRYSTVQPNMNLANPNAVYHDQNYGTITDNRNIYDKPALLDTLGPLAVGGFGGVLGGMGGVIGNALRSIPQFLNSTMHNGLNPMAAVSIAAPFIPGASAVMPYVNAARQVYNITRKP